MDKHLQILAQQHLETKFVKACLSPRSGSYLILRAAVPKPAVFQASCTARA